MNRQSATLLLTLSAALGAVSGVQAASIDLTAAGSSATINGALFQVSGPNTGAGSGSIDSFLRTHAGSVEAGFNTDGDLTLDQVSGCCTHAITLGQLAIVDVGGDDYYALRLDINEPGGTKSGLTLQALELWVNTATGSDDDYSDGLGTKVWDLAGDTVDLDGSIAPGGSGNFDYDVLLPTSLLAGFSAGDFLYLYNVFGEIDGSGFAAEGGFEEWSVSTNNLAPVPAPAAVWLLATGVVGLMGWSRRKAAA